VWRRAGDGRGHGKAPLRCSFCAKSQGEVRKLIAGPKVYICDECIQLCVDIMAEEWEEEVRRTAEESRDNTNPQAMGAAVCALCDVPTSMGLLVEIPARGFLCFACLDAIRAATESESSNGQ
jgi:hypothetical protein